MELCGYGLKGLLACANAVSDASAAASIVSTGGTALLELPVGENDWADPVAVRQSRLVACTLDLAGLSANNSSIARMRAGVEVRLPKLVPDFIEDWTTDGGFVEVLLPKLTPDCIDCIDEETADDGGIVVLADDGVPASQPRICFCCRRIVPPLGASKWSLAHSQIDVAGRPRQFAGRWSQVPTWARWFAGILDVAGELSTAS
ncbi:hypothetical protein HK101_004404 [Irineochytrium annulatum]|nr:hypothetical protein HK101_004404 [Irineochytrium annulatum]